MFGQKIIAFAYVETRSRTKAPVNRDSIPPSIPPRYVITPAFGSRMRFGDPFEGDNRENFEQALRGYQNKGIEIITDRLPFMAKTKRQEPLDIREPQGEQLEVNITPWGTYHAQSIDWNTSFFRLDPRAI